MKKINSIGYGGKVIGVGTVLLAAIPLILKVVSYITGRLVFPLLSKISFGCGTVILIGFAILLAIELHQDRVLYERAKKENPDIK